MMQTATLDATYIFLHVRYPLSHLRLGIHILYKLKVLYFPRNTPIYNILEITLLDSVLVIINTYIYIYIDIYIRL